MNAVPPALPAARRLPRLAAVWARAPAGRAPDVNAAVHPLDTIDAIAARVLLTRTAERSLDVQYYIWRDDITGRLLWRELRLATERGVRVRVLTNSLAATDVAAVHAGCSKRCRALLEGGVQLFELRPEARSVPPPNREQSGAGGRAGGSSDASLHAKTFGVDRRTIFVGSVNFDPRSAALNTELGVVLDSPRLAGRLATLFDTEVPRLAYEARLDAQGGLEWIERTPHGEQRHTRDPGTGVLERASAGLMSILPIEWLL